MNKIAKASIAGAAGVILLMGGAGSLAYWNSTASLGSSGTAVTAGQLAATPVTGSGNWTVAFNGGTTQTDITSTIGSTFKLVPGDKLTYSQTFNVTATGNDLLFSVAVTNPTLDATDPLGKRLVVAAGAPVVKNSSGTTQTANANGSYSAVTGTITVTQTFTWAGNFTDSTSTTADNAAQNKSYTLPTGGVVTLTQVAS